MPKKEAEKNSQKYTNCDCGNDISTMLGCKKKGPRYYCNKCQKDVSLKKYEQLIRRIKES